MITGRDIYDVLSALVPLYVAMILAYGSVRWWHIFTPDQCAGINRFVAVFAVPLLSFHFISSNDPYAMNFRFLAADSLAKVVILAALFLWSLTRFGSLDWSITFFSIATLPNTLVMGVPLLRAMYGDFSASLMVQIVVLQSVIWYTLLIFLFEYRGAKALISEQFPPDVARSIAEVEVEPDVVSLSSMEGLQANAETRSDGKIRVVVRRSDSYSRSVASTPGLVSVDPVGLRDQDLTDTEIYSVASSREGTPRALSLKEANFYPMSSRKATRLKGNESGSRGVNSTAITPYPTPNAAVSGKHETGVNNDLHMFVWSSSLPARPDRELNRAFRAPSVNSGDDAAFSGADLHHHTVASRGHDASRSKESGMENEIRRSKRKPLTTTTTESPLLPTGDAVADGEGEEGRASRAMPPATVVTKLILVMVWRKLITNPNTYASIIGLVWSLISFRWHVGLPKIVQGSITILSNTGLGMAMFSLGLFMALQPKIIACGKTMALLSMAVRFLVGPIAVAVASLAVGLRGDILRVAILQAALPEGIVPFVFAKEYACHAGILSTAVIFGMVIALPITIIYYILLGLKV